MAEGTLSQQPAGSEILVYGQEPAESAAEEFPDLQGRTADLERIKTNALAQERVLRIQEKLDEIRSDRAKELIAEDTDQTTGKVRNGLFGWRAIGRSLQSMADIARSSRDYATAEESVDESGVKNEHIETMMSEAADGFSSLSDEYAKQEMSNLLSVIAERYKLDQDARDTNPVVSKIRTIIGSNSVAINMAIGATFRIIFKGATHATGLGGAILTSAIYGGASKGIGEYRSARSELLGSEGWREALERMEYTEQKLELMRQMVSSPEVLRRYFAGNSSEAFEFFSQYQQLLAQSEQDGQTNELDIINPSAETIYVDRNKEIRSRAWRAAGKGAATAALYSAVGYGITHFVSEFLHGDTAHAAEDSPDPTAQGESGAAVPITEVRATPETSSKDVVWRWNGIPHQPRLVIDQDTHLFAAGSNDHPQFAEVKIIGNVKAGDTGSTPEEVAKVIAKSIGDKEGTGHFGLTDEQKDKIQGHITEWLKTKRAGEIHDGEFATGTTVRVDASEINDALKDARINEIELTGVEAGPDIPPAPEAGDSAGPETAPADAGDSAPSGDDGTPVDTPAAEQPDSGTGDTTLPPGAEATGVPSGDGSDRPGEAVGAGRPPTPDTGTDEAQLPPGTTVVTDIELLPEKPTPEPDDTSPTISKIILPSVGIALVAVAIWQRKRIFGVAGRAARATAGGFRKAYSTIAETGQQLFQAAPPSLEHAQSMVDKKHYEEAYREITLLPEDERNNDLMMDAGVGYLDQMVKRARRKKSQKLYQTTLGLVSELVQISPDNPRVLAVAGECAFRTGDSRAALQHLEKINSPTISDNFFMVKALIKLTGETRDQSQLEKALGITEYLIQETGGTNPALAHYFATIILFRLARPIEEIRVHVNATKSIYGRHPDKEWQEILAMCRDNN